MEVLIILYGIICLPLMPIIMYFQYYKVYITYILNVRKIVVYESELYKSGQIVFF